jgi:hypothetical protein
MLMKEPILYCNNVMTIQRSKDRSIDKIRPHTVCNPLGYILSYSAALCVCVCVCEILEMSAEQQQKALSSGPRIVGAVVYSFVRSFI